jgi:hypothetical protein
MSKINFDLQNVEKGIWLNIYENGTWLVFWSEGISKMSNNMGSVKVTHRIPLHQAITEEILSNYKIK